MGQEQVQNVSLSRYYDPGLRELEGQKNVHVTEAGFHTLSASPPPMMETSFFFFLRDKKSDEVTRQVTRFRIRRLKDWLCSDL